MREFGKVLADMLEQKGMTAYRLAQLAGLGQPSVSKLINGQSQPTWDTVQKIRVALGVEFADLVTIDEEPPEVAEKRGRGRPKKKAEGE